MMISYELLIGTIIFLLSIIGFFLVRFINSVDNMNNVLNDLKDLINKIQTDSQGQKKLCEERHASIDKKFKRIDEHVGNLYKGHNDNRDKIAKLREELINKRARE